MRAAKRWVRRSVGPGAAMGEVELGTGAGEAVGLVTRTVVGEHAARRDAELAEPGDGHSQEVGRTALGLVRIHGGEGQPGVVPSAALVSRVLRRLKLNRICDLEPRLPANRYEHAAPGDLLHLDIKRLVRIQRPSHRVTGDRRDGIEGIAAEFLHVAIVVSLP